MSFPGENSLGYGLNIIGTTPFDIGAVESAVLRGRRLLSIDFNNVRDLVVDGVTYRVPRDVSINNDNPAIQGQLLSFPDGKSAARAFVADDSNLLRYLAVSGTTTAAFATQQSFLEDHQYAFFSFARASYTARHSDYTNSLAEEPLINWLRGVSKTFDPSRQEIVAQYRDFFSTFGSHIIHSIIYGARYPLNVWASNRTAAVNARFDANVRSKFNGIPSGGVFDVAIRNEAQYRQFEEYFQYLVTVSGGGSIDRSRLTNIDATYADYQAWVNSIDRNSPALLSFEVVGIWSLLKLAKNSELREYADPVQEAFNYIVGHPVVFRTAVSLDIQSDWAEFSLLTPSAVIIPDPNNPYPSTNIVASDTRLRWGKEYSHQYQRLTLRFFVINNGSPIDFSISRGSLAGPTTFGTAIATFEGRTYINNRVTDNVWNTHWFYNAPVNSVPVLRRGTTRVEQPFNFWSDVLRDYLAGIRQA